MSRYVLKKIDICPSCSGSGQMDHPEWERFRNWVDEHQLFPTVDDARLCKKWWSDRGYARPPEEEIECDDCGGTGLVEVQVASWLDRPAVGSE